MGLIYLQPRTELINRKGIWQINNDYITVLYLEKKKKDEEKNWR